MLLLGIGTEIVECLKIRRLIEQHGEHFLGRVYTESEISYCQSHRLATEQFAARWAAKVAVLKCLGAATKKPAFWHEIETNSQAGELQVNLIGNLADRASHLGVGHIMLSSSFCRAYATATALSCRK